MDKKTLWIAKNAINQIALREGKTVEQVRKEIQNLRNHCSRNTSGWSNSLHHYVLVAQQNHHELRIW